MLNWFDKNIQQRARPQFLWKRGAHGGHHMIDFYYPFFGTCCTNDMHWSIWLNHEGVASDKHFECCYRFKKPQCISISHSQSHYITEQAIFFTLLLLYSAWPPFSIDLSISDCPPFVRALAICGGWAAYSTRRQELNWTQWDNWKNGKWWRKTVTILWYQILHFHTKGRNASTVAPLWKSLIIFYFSLQSWPENVSHKLQNRTQLIKNDKIVVFLQKNHWVLFIFLTHLVSCSSMPLDRSWKLS